MDDETWRPLGSEGRPGFEGLTDGMPEWLAPSFWSWVRRQFARTSGGSVRAFLNTDLLRQAERVLRFDARYAGTDLGTGLVSLRSVVEQLGTELRLADFLLATRERSAWPAEVRTMFEEAGSAWTVGTRAGKPGLVKRVEAGVQVAAEHTMNTGGRAGERLAEAWTAAFGLSPNPSTAYSLAIKSVEDAAIPVVEPRNQSATLGTVIMRMRSVPFRFEVPRERGEVTSRAALLLMLSLLWHGQGDRHGGLPDASVTITQEAAEAAVLLAVPLVQLFASGAVVPA